MAVNIGEKIKQRAQELRMGPTELGKLVNTSKQNIYGIYKRKSIDTEMLRKLSKALNLDFFQYYQNEQPNSWAETSPAYSKKGRNAVSAEEFQRLKKDYDDLREKYNNLNEKYDNLKEKYDLTKKVNQLLERKIGK